MCLRRQRTNCYSKKLFFVSDTTWSANDSSESTYLSVRLGAGDNAPGSASKSYEVGLVGALPYPDFSEDVQSRIAQLTRNGIDAVRMTQFEIGETTTGFVVPPAIKYRASWLREAALAWVRQREERLIQWADVEEELDNLVAEAFGFHPLATTRLWGRSLKFH